MQCRVDKEETENGLPDLLESILLCVRASGTTHRQERMGEGGKEGRRESIRGGEG